MKKLLLVSVFLTLVLTVFHQPIFTYAQEENTDAADTTTDLATCDLCGYCMDNRIPDAWTKCRDCIYPDLGEAEAETNATLQVIDNVPITPKPGRIYTMIGCISTQMNSFQEEGAAASVIQILLNIIFSAAGGIGFLYLIYGSFIILTSQANPEKINYGKRLVLGAIVGVIFSLSAVFIVNLIAGGILKIPGFDTSTTSNTNVENVNSGFTGGTNTNE